MPSMHVTGSQQTVWSVSRFRRSTDAYVLAVGSHESFYVSNRLCSLFTPQKARAVLHLLVGDRALAVE
jgi:hypothetical protein